MRPTVGTCTMAIPPTASCGPFRKITIMNEHIIEAVSSTVDLGRCAAKCIAGEPVQVGTDISATHHPSSALPGQPPHDALATVQAPVVRGLIDLLRQDLCNSGPYRLIVDAGVRPIWRVTRDASTLPRVDSGGTLYA